MVGACAPSASGTAAMRKYIKAAHDRLRTDPLPGLGSIAAVLTLSLVLVQLLWPYRSAIFTYFIAPLFCVAIIIGYFKFCRLIEGHFALPIAAVIFYVFSLFQLFSILSIAIMGLFSIFSAAKFRSICAAILSALDEDKLPADAKVTFDAFATVNLIPQGFTIVLYALTFLGLVGISANQWLRFVRSAKATEREIETMKAKLDILSRLEDRKS
jgi:hypothetical protein